MFISCDPTALSRQTLVTDEKTEVQESYITSDTQSDPLPHYKSSHWLVTGDIFCSMDLNLQQREKQEGARK